jgi:hypothetical protein
VDADRAFDPRVRGPVREEAPSRMFTHLYADDVFACSFEPLAGWCPRGALGPRARDILINPAYGTDNMDGGCVSRREGRYIMRIYGDVTARLLGDDVLTRPFIP